MYRFNLGKIDLGLGKLGCVKVSVNRDRVCFGLHLGGFLASQTEIPYPVP